MTQLAITSGRRRMWRACRYTRCFSARDLAAIAAVPLPTASRFIRALRHAGLVRRANPWVPPTETTPALWVLARDTGPALPRIPRGANHV